MKLYNVEFVPYEGESEYVLIASDCDYSALRAAICQMASHRNTTASKLISDTKYIGCIANDGIE